MEDQNGEVIDLDLGTVPSFLDLPNDVLHFVMFHLELRDIIRLLSVCRYLKDFIEKQSNNFWYIKYQVSCPFEWLHRLQNCNSIFQAEKRASSVKDPGYMILQEFGMALLLSHKSKIPAQGMHADGKWTTLKEDDCNPIHYKHLHPVKLYWSISYRSGSYSEKQIEFPEPSTSLCKELQYCDFPQVLYLVQNLDDLSRSRSLMPKVSITRYFHPGKYVVTWRLAVDENPSLTDIHLNVCEQYTQSTGVMFNTVITQNELKLMKGKGWFVHTMKEPFNIEVNQRRIGFPVLTQIGVKGGAELSGIWIDWVRVVNKKNKVMMNFIKKEASIELTIQRMQEKTKRMRRK